MIVCALPSPVCMSRLPPLPALPSHRRRSSCGLWLPALNSTRSPASMRPLAFLLVFIALMASSADAHTVRHGRLGIRSARDGRWPDLVGRDAQEARNHILSEIPSLNVQILPADMMMTMDYNTNRVRIIVNNEQKVVKCPTIG